MMMYTKNDFIQHFNQPCSYGCSSVNDTEASIAAGLALPFSGTQKINLWVTRDAFKQDIFHVYLRYDLA